MFDIKKPRWAEYWIQHEYPVMLVIRSSDGQIRWFNATEYLKQKQAEGEWPVKQIVFDAEDFSPLNLLKNEKNYSARDQSGSRLRSEKSLRVESLTLL